MLPVLIHFTFTSLASQLLLFAVALVMVVSIARNGWLGTEGAAPTSGQRLMRALGYGAVAGGLAFIGLRYALPADVLPGGQGQGIPVHSYGLLLAAGFLTAMAVASRLAQDE